MNEKISLKISQLQFVLCTMIVVMHSMTLSYTGLNDSPLASIFQYTLGGGLCQIAVPIFFIISAYLFYWNCDSLTTLKRKVFSRIHTLVIPYFIWNIIWELYYFLLWKIGYSEKDFSTYSFIDYLIEIIQSQNTALWFVKWLIVFSICSPIIFKMLNSKKITTIVGILTITIILIFKISYYSIIYWIPFYLLGAFVAHNHCDLLNNMMLLSTKRKKILMLTSLFLLLAGIVIVLISWESFYVIWAFRIMGSIAALCIMFLLPTSSADKHFSIFDYTFPIYCIHVPLVGILKHILKGTIGFVVIPIIVIAFIYFISKLVKNKAPRLYAVAFGRL